MNGVRPVGSFGSRPFFLRRPITRKGSHARARLPLGPGEGLHTQAPKKITQMLLPLQ